ncbi:MAG: hypothetical protein ACRD3R_17685, partial [Terriglobales bacterium]
MTYKRALGPVLLALILAPVASVFAQTQGAPAGGREETKPDSTSSQTAEPPPASSPAQPADAEEEAPPIQDNSFLMEEAYNQEYGVVQHINFFGRFWESRDWTYVLTQEWPVNAAPRHQLSYSIAATHAGALSGSG